MKLWSVPQKPLILRAGLCHFHTRLCWTRGCGCRHRATAALRDPSQQRCCWSMLCSRLQMHTSRIYAPVPLKVYWAFASELFALKNATSNHSTALN